MKLYRNWATLFNRCHDDLTNEPLVFYLVFYFRVNYIQFTKKPRISMYLQTPLVIFDCLHRYNAPLSRQVDCDVTPGPCIFVFLYSSAIIENALLSLESYQAYSETPSACIPGETPDLPLVQTTITITACIFLKKKNNKGNKYTKRWGTWTYTCNILWIDSNNKSNIPQHGHARELCFVLIQCITTRGLYIVIKTNSSRSWADVNGICKVKILNIRNRSWLSLSYEVCLIRFTLLSVHVHKFGSNCCFNVPNN